jgi:hypothetical protein
MKQYRLAAGALAGLMLMSTGQAAPPISHFPQQRLEKFLAEKFDLASIRSSFGPRRTSAQRTFSDMGLKPSKADQHILEFDAPGDWFYSVKILGRRDVNNDGIEDLELCFTDRAQNGGSYSTVQGLVVTRYVPDGYAVALSYALDHKDCVEYRR